MTIKAQVPADSTVAVGDRFTYTAADGRVAHYQVTATDVVAPWYRMTGSVVLVADEPGWGTVTMAPASLASSMGWAREQAAAGEGVARGVQPRPVGEGTGSLAGPDVSPRQDEAEDVSTLGWQEATDPDLQGQVFGVWDAPVTGHDVPITTPVGNVCVWCEEAIRPGDNGRISPVGHTLHRECQVRAVLGGIGHLVDHERYCHSELGTDAGLTRRQSSLLVWEWFQETHMEPTAEQAQAWKARIG